MEGIKEQIKQYHEKQSNSFVLWTNMVLLINQWDGVKNGLEGWEGRGTILK